MPRRIIDPDSDGQEEEVAQSTRRPRGGGGGRQRIVDPDDSGEEEVEVAQPTRSTRASRGGRTSRTSHSTRAAAPTQQRSRNNHRRIETIEEEAEEDEEETERSSRRRTTRTSHATRPPAAASSSQRPRNQHRRQQRSETVEEEEVDDNQNNRTVRSRTSIFDPLDPSTKRGDSIGDTVLAVFALSAKGPIKEVDIKPLLLRGRYRDWQDGLDELNKCLSTAFGFTLVYDGVARLFFLRNDLSELKAELSEIFENGTLNKARIDDGSLSKRLKIFVDEDEFNDDDKKGLLFTLLASIMMANNVEMGHKNWAVEEEVIKHMCIDNMGISEAVFEKLLSGKTAEFIKDGWIRKKEETMGDSNHLIHYSWGPRAVGTVSTLKIFEKFCMINHTPKLEWGNYEEILKKLDQKNDLYHPRR